MVVRQHILLLILALMGIILAAGASADACYNSVQNVPVNCTGASISSDTWDGGRHITCGTTTIAAWDKTGFFEMYKQAGGSGIQVCIGTTCIKDGGYAKSTNFPICIGNSTSSNSTNTTSPPPNMTNACYNSVQSIPASCGGGSITTDSWNGCRTLVCASGGNSLQALACDKSGFFEMYRQTQVGTGSFNICIGPTCLGNAGYVKSANFPLCTGTNSTNGTNTTSPPPNSTTNACYNSVQSIPASCAGASISSDTWDGGRHITCGTTTIAAWDKTGFFEMYKQAGGSGIKVCLGNTCISDNGYAKSANFPLCTNSTGSAGGIVWIEPVDNQVNTPPNSFHLNVQTPSDAASIGSAEWEVWDQALAGRVWYANNTGSLMFHTHTPDGAFQGSLSGKTQLDWLTTYKVHTRWAYANGTITPWSSWRTFTTASQQNGTNITWTAAPGFQVERVATGLDVPVHIAFAPKGKYDALPASQAPLYYVTELYGKVKVIHRDGSIGTYAQDLLNFNPFGSITGGGQMGVIGLYADQSGDLFVGTVYVDDQNRTFNKVLRFTSTSDGNTYTNVTAIISGLPSAPSHQIETITKGPDGKLYVQLGDALNSANAQNDAVLAGKIIRMNPDGTGVEVYAKGFRNPFGGDWQPGTGRLYVTDNSPDSNDRLLRVSQGGNYLWGTGTNDYIGQAIDLLNVSPVDVKFNRGSSGFPNDTAGRMYVAVGGPIYTKGPTNGKEIWEYTLDGSGNISGKRHFLQYTGTGYGTPIGLDFGPDGLYFTDIYGEPGFTGLGKTEGNVYRITPGSGGCINCGGTGTFRAGIQVIPWYPKDNGNGIEYVFECNGIEGSGNYTYDFNLGNGQKTMNYQYTRIGPVTYPYGDVDYTVSCTVHDRSSGQAAGASMVINPSDFISSTE